MLEKSTRKPPSFCYPTRIISKGVLLRTPLKPHALSLPAQRINYALITKASANGKTSFCTRSLYRDFAVIYCPLGAKGDILLRNNLLLHCGRVYSHSYSSKVFGHIRKKTLLPLFSTIVCSASVQIFQRGFAALLSVLTKASAPLASESSNT